jgi:hypothetical protein
VPPTATATKVTIPPHPQGFEECLAGGGTCGSAPIRVVCAPDGWFVDRPDVNGTFPATSNGWRVVVVDRSGEAPGACQ